jgi:hypothetical protein
MRNGDNRDTEGLTPQDGVYSPGVARRSRRRKHAMIGVGLFVLLGGGGLVATQALDDDTPATRTGALDSPALLPGASQPASGVEPSPSAGARSGAAPAKPAVSAGAPRPVTDDERITAARSAAAKAGSQVRRPLPPNGGAVASVSDADVTTSTTEQGGGTLRVMSARKDLTGHGELALVADKGEKVGNARCTQKIRVSANVEAKVRPTLLLCWRTSAQKSVYTVAVVTKGRPSTKASATAIDKEWSRLG